MSEKQEFAAIGIGSPLAVLEYYLAQCDGNLSAVSDLQAVYNAMTELLDEPSTQRAGLALCCAFANRGFVESGDLLKVSERGHVRSEWEANPDKRKLIAHAIGM